MIPELKAKNPIVHCITNHVVSNFQANGLLALGASPIMGEAPEEAEELAALADAVSLNIGTLNSSSLKSMLLAGKAANRLGIPVVLDPVGVGATRFRAQAVADILAQVNITVLRCNAGELAAIAGAEWNSKGVDAGDGDADITELAKNVAIKYGLLVAVTGTTDIVTDGKQVAKIPYGDEVMASITGMGCLLSATVAAFLSVSNKHNAFAATVAALQFYALAGEAAAEKSRLPGDFQTAFLNQLAVQEGHETDEQNLLKVEEASK